jgi:hypothetical protein
VKGMHTRMKEKRTRKGGVHGAGSSDELGRDSGEKSLRRGGLPRAVEVSAGSARGRWSSGQDGAACDELERPERC